jgi:hypothetical protein
MKINSRLSLHHNGKITERRRGRFVSTTLDVYVCESCNRITPKVDLIEENGFVHRVQQTHCKHCGKQF